MPEAFDFAVSGINHNHIYGQVDAMLGAGCRLTAFHAPEDDLAAEFAKRLPAGAARRRRARDPRRSQRVRLVVGAGIPGDRAGDGAPRHARRQGRDGRQARLHHRGRSSPSSAASRPTPAASTRSATPSTTCSPRPSPPPASSPKARSAGSSTPSASGRTRSACTPAPTGSGTPPAAARSSSTSPRTSSSSSSTSPARPPPASSRAVEANLAHPDRARLERLRPRHRRLRPRHRLRPRRLDDPRGLAGLGRRPPLPDGHRGHHRAPQVHGHRRPPRRRPPLPHRRQGHPLHGLHGHPARLRRAPARRRPQPHRDRHAPGRTASAPWSSRSTPTASPPRSARSRRHDPAQGRRRRLRHRRLAHRGLPGAPRPVRGRRPLRHRRRPRRRGRASGSASPRPPTGSSDLLERDLDIIDICTPSGLHQAQAIAALEAGFHAVVEKPVAKSLAELDAIAAAEARPRQARLPDLPVPLRPRHPEAAPPDRPRASPAAASVATAETHWYRGDGLLRRRRLARHLRRRARRLPHHARHPHPRHALRGARPRSPRCTPAPRTGSTATRPRTWPSSRSASPPAPSPPPRSPSARARRPRACASASTTSSPRAASRPTTPATIPGPSRTTTRTPPAASRRRSPTSRRCPSASSASSTACTRRSPQAAPLPVTLADARRSIELLTAAYYSALTGEPVAAAAHPRPPVLRRLARRHETWRPRMAELELRKVVKRFGSRRGDPRRRPQRSATASSSSSSAPPAAASRRCCG